MVLYKERYYIKMWFYSAKFTVCLKEVEREMEAPTKCGLLKAMEMSRLKKIVEITKWEKSKKKLL